MVLGVVLAAAMSQSGCEGECAGAVTCPTVPVPGETTVVAALPGPEVSAATAPQAVFLSQPPADENGVILGPPSFTVEFNLCQSRPGDADDDLQYSYDFDGDGTVDERGHCRASRVYRGGGSVQICTPVRVCVGRTEVCRRYEVCRGGPGRGALPGRRSPAIGQRHGGLMSEARRPRR
jgi:hypothetical protein